MKYKHRESLTAWFFILPDFVGQIVFIMLPAVLGFIISLSMWDGLGKPTFVGFENYFKMFSDPIFMKSLVITVKYVIWFVPLNFIFSLLMALLIREKSKGVTIFRTIYFAPTAISLISVGFVWSYMFQSNGFINSLLSNIGIEKQEFLGSTDQAFYIVLAMSLYMSVGYFMIIFLGGLNDISREYYDAAEVDGANILQKFWYISFPLLKPTSFFVLVMSFIRAFQFFDQIYVLTSGGPFYSTTNIVFYAFQNAFQYYHFGYAAAMDFFVFLVLLILSLISFKIMKGGEIK